MSPFPVTSDTPNFFSYRVFLVDFGERILTQKRWFLESFMRVIPVGDTW